MTQAPDQPEERGPRSFHDLSRGGSESPLATYQDITIGNRRLWDLIRYESLVTVFGCFPGALGMAARRLCFPALFADCGHGNTFGMGLMLRQPGRIRLGSRCVLDDFAGLSVRGDEAGITLGNRVFLGRQSVVNVRDAHIDIADDTSIGSNCRLGCDGGRITIGRYVLVASYCYLGGGAHRTDRTDIPMALQGNVSKGGVTIEDDVWIGARSMVMDGVTIRRGSIIGAGSLVTHDIPEYSVAYGSPAEVVRQRPRNGED